MKTLPWTVKQTGPNSADDDFIMRQIKGADGKNVALVTTGDYTDDVEAEHAAFIAKAANAYPRLLALAHEYVAYMANTATPLNGAAKFLAELEPRCHLCHEVLADSYDVQLDGEWVKLCWPCYEPNMKINSMTDPMPEEPRD